MKRVILCFTFALMCGVGMRLPQAAAKDETFTLPILAIQCATLPGADEYPFDDWQHPCEPSPDLGFTVTDAATDEVLGTCITAISPAPEPQPSAYCNVPIGYSAQVTVTIDSSTVPEGYLPVDESAAVTAPNAAVAGNVPTARFMIVLQPDPSGDGPTTQLPSTGSGATTLIKTVNHLWN